MRAPGLTWFRLPLFVWANYATSIIMVLATPVLAMTLLLLAIERLFGIGFFERDIAKAFDVSWPAISQNLRVLHAAGLIRQRRVGTSRLYRADRAALKPLEPFLRKMWERKIDRLRLLAESEERAKSKR